MTQRDVLLGLKARYEKAIRELTRPGPDGPEVERKRHKAEGVSLALSYVNEELRATPPLLTEADPAMDSGGAG